MLLRPTNIHSNQQPDAATSDQAEQLTTLNISNVGLVVIYMGDTCNFDCVYCDREYIKKDIGSQNLR